MATEQSRQISVRRITAPGETSTNPTDYVDLKVIDVIRFKDPRDNNQEWEITYQNNPDAAREVHVVEVGSDKLKVERIDSLKSAYKASEWKHFYDNSDNPPVHYETHKRKIYQLNRDGTKNTSVWIEVQRIDAIWFKDPKDNGQETVWRLDWPDLQDEEWDYKDLPKPDKRWDGTAINPPWRLDPFQTIVDCSFGGKVMLVLYGNNNIATISMDGLSDPKPNKRTLESSNFGSPSYWFPFSGPVYYQVAQVKISDKICAMSAQIDFSNSTASAAPHGYNQFVYNTADTILAKANAVAPLNQANTVTNVTITEGGHPSYITSAGVRPYFDVNQDINQSTGAATWDALARGKFYEIVGSSPFLQDQFIADTPWWLFGGPVLNGSGNLIYNERGDKFDVSAKITISSSGVSADTNLYHYVQGVGVNGERWGEWWQGAGYSYDYTVSPSFDVPDIPPGETSIGQVGPTPDVGTIKVTPADLEMPVWSKAIGKPVFSRQAVRISYNEAIFSFVYEDVAFGEAWWIQFPYSLYEGNKVKPFVALFDDETLRHYPQNSTLVTPYGNFPIKAWLLSFQGWLSLHTDKHTLQAWMIRDDETTIKRYIFLDGVDYGSKLATALGCSIDEIRAIFFDIKTSDVSKLK